MDPAARGAPGTGDEVARALAADSLGRVYIAGDVEMAAGSQVFLALYDSGGNQVWRRQFGSGAFDRARALALDPGGVEEGVYIGGGTTGNLGGTHAGSSDAWLARYDSDGNRIWITQFGTPADEEVTALAAGSWGSWWSWAPSGVVAGGYTHGDLFGPSAGSSDIFVATFDRSSALRMFARQLGTGAADGAVGSADQIIVGYTDGVLGAAGAGARDTIVAEFSWVLCHANCDNSLHPVPILNLEDFTCFINEFARAWSLPQHLQVHTYANCDGSTTPPVLNVEDFACFINAFAAGCL
jgi:hypothetical protein